MRKSLRCVTLLLVFTTLHHSGSSWAINDPVDDVDRSFALGQFGRMVEILEHQIGSNLTLAKSDQLVRLCFAYSKTKRYGQLDLCLNELDRKIEAGDRSGGKFGSWWAKPTWFVTSRMPSGLMLGTKDWDISPYPDIMRAEAAIDQGNYPLAIEAALKAQGKLTSNQTQGNYFQIDIPGFLAIAYAHMGQKNKALEYIQQLYKQDITSFATSSAEIYLRTNLARALVAIGDYRAAHEIILKDNTSGVRAMASGFAGMKADESLWEWEETPRNYMRHKCELEIGLLKEAKAGFDALLEKRTIQDHSGIYWLLLFDRSRIAEADGDTDSAVLFLKQSIDVIERQRSTINTEASKIGFAGDKQAVYAALTRLLLAQGDIAAAFEYAERAKARALVDMLAAKQDFAIRSRDPAKVKELLTRASQAETELMIQEGASGKASQRSAMRHAQQQLKSESPELASLVSVSTLTAGEVQALIPADETLIEYYQNGTDLIAFIVTPRELKAVRLDGTALLESVRQFRERLEEVDTNNYLPLGTQLYDQLIRPIAAELKSGKLAIVAHGPLHYLPFNALHDGQHFLIDRYSLRFLPSASVIKYIRTQPVAKPGEILALGNPDLGNPQMDLANAQAEAIAIAKGRSQSKVLLRKEASEMAFRQYGENFRYIHFATHGLFNPESPLKSALLLAKDTASDGLLTVGKLYSMKLDADLVTLSACETGIGKIANGDDVVGLNRGFLYAGSRSIVASLWKVDDQATSYLMTRFYDQLKRSNKEEALRQAQIETRKNYPHPYFWAAFQITGSPS